MTYRNYEAVLQMGKCLSHGVSRAERALEQLQLQTMSEHSQ